MIVSRLAGVLTVAAGLVSQAHDIASDCTGEHGGAITIVSGAKLRDHRPLSRFTWRLPLEGNLELLRQRRIAQVLVLLPPSYNVLRSARTFITGNKVYAWLHGYLHPARTQCESRDSMLPS